MGEQTIRVVVVEDEKRLARNIAAHISGIPSFEAAAVFYNGEDAWQYIKVQPPHIVITDIAMPLMDGIELVQRIHDSGLPVHCVILTGYADFRYAQAALRADVEDYLLKPINPDDLKSLMKKLELKIRAETPDTASLRGSENLKPEEIVTLVKGFIKNHYTEDISLQVISQELGFSPSYLTKVFNKTDGRTPSVYLREYRMNIAKRLLDDPSATVGAVSRAVGYPDPYHFSKSFKQTFGYSPSEHRRK